MLRFIYMITNGLMLKNDVDHPLEIGRSEKVVDARYTFRIMLYIP